jgi:precorrin-6B methylase 2
MASDLKPAAGQTVVDLGAGYGRLGFVISRHYEGVRFVGYELGAERVAEGRRALRAAGIDPGLIELIQADLAAPDYEPIAADFYFIYDYGTRDAIAKTLADLQKLARQRPITVAGRGRAARDAIERGEPWLSQVIPPVHRGRYSIYRSG